MKKLWNYRYTFSIFLLGLVLLSVGIANEESRVLFEKAIRICLECVGIG